MENVTIDDVQRWIDTGKKDGRWRHLMGHAMNFMDCKRVLELYTGQNHNFKIGIPHDDPFRKPEMIGDIEAVCYVNFHGVYMIPMCVDLFDNDASTEQMVVMRSKPYIWLSTKQADIEQVCCRAALEDLLIGKGITINEKSDTNPDVTYNTLCTINDAFTVVSKWNIVEILRRGVNALSANAVKRVRSAVESNPSLILDSIANQLCLDTDDIEANPFKYTNYTVDVGSPFIPYGIEASSNIISNLVRIYAQAIISGEDKFHATVNE